MCEKVYTTTTVLKYGIVFENGLEVRTCKKGSGRRIIFFFLEETTSTTNRRVKREKKNIERLEIMFKDIADLFLNIRRKTSSLLLIANNVACICGRIVGNTEHRYLCTHSVTPPEN